MASLALLCLGWELFWAPARPGGSWLALKALPLALALPGLWSVRLRTYQWWSMLILLYICEGLVRAMSDPSRTSQWLGAVEATLATLCFGLILWTCRAARGDAGQRVSTPES